MLCLPGLTPVWNDDQATGEIGGTVEPSGWKQPWSRRAARWGSLPSSSIVSVRPWSMPSRPRITTRLNAALRQRPQAEQRPHQQADRPGEQRQERRADGGEHGEERPGQREARPRPDVGEGRGRGAATTRSDDQERAAAYFLLIGLISCSSGFSSVSSSSTVLPGFRSLPGETRDSRRRTGRRGRARRPRRPGEQERAEAHPAAGTAGGPPGPRSAGPPVRRGRREGRRGRSRPSSA